MTVKRRSRRRHRGKEDRQEKEEVKEEQGKVEVLERKDLEEVAAMRTKTMSPSEKVGESTKPALFQKV